jgi:hypothetical protein
MATFEITVEERQTFRYRIDAKDRDEARQRAARVHDASGKAADREVETIDVMELRADEITT